MNLADFLAKITGQSDRLEAATNKLEAAITASNAKDTEIASLRAQVAAFTPADTEALNAQIATLTQERDTALARATTAEATLESERAAMPERINAEAARIIAANGHEQVDTLAGKKQEEPTKPGAGLTGIAKATALLQAKLPQPVKSTQP